MNATADRVLFVGESPPPGAPPDFKPFDCASGDRLATQYLGLRSRALMLEHTTRTNIFTLPTGLPGCSPWDADLALAAGETLLDAAIAAGHRVVVALGRKVATALGLQEVPVGCIAEGCLVLPHPSGRSTAANDPAARAAIRRALLPEVVCGNPSLRPWHFAENGLDPHRQPLVDLGAALSPLRPALGLAVVTVVRELHASVVGDGTSSTVDESPLRASLGTMSLRRIAEGCATDCLASLFPSCPKDRFAKEVRHREKSITRNRTYADYQPDALRAAALRLRDWGVA